MSYEEPPTSPEHDAHDHQEEPAGNLNPEAIHEAIQVIERSITMEAEQVFHRLIPLASDLASEMAHFNHDIESVNASAMAEKNALDAENAR